VHTNSPHHSNNCNTYPSRMLQVTNKQSYMKLWASTLSWLRMSASSCHECMQQESCTVIIHPCKGCHTYHVTSPYSSFLMQSINTFMLGTSKISHIFTTEIQWWVTLTIGLGEKWITRSLDISKIRFMCALEWFIDGSPYLQKWGWGELQVGHWEN